MSCSARRWSKGEGLVSEKAKALIGGNETSYHLVTRTRIKYPAPITVDGLSDLLPLPSVFPGCKHVHVKMDNRFEFVPRKYTMGYPILKYRALGDDKPGAVHYQIQVKFTFTSPDFYNRHSRAIVIVPKFVRFFLGNQGQIEEMKTTEMDTELYQGKPKEVAYTLHYSPAPNMCSWPCFRLLSVGGEVPAFNLERLCIKYTRLA